MVEGQDVAVAAGDAHQEEEAEVHSGLHPPSPRKRAAYRFKDSGEVTQHLCGTSNQYSSPTNGMHLPGWITYDLEATFAG